jgi:3,4-dihydroxyphenylacetate 2,3-dioxygenase
MSGGIYRGIVCAHVPRMGRPEIVPEFQKGLVAGVIEMGEDIRADKPDVIIVCSTHYVSTFNWIASTVTRHKGYCVAMEAPDLLPGDYYDYKGDPELGHAIKDEITAAGFPCVENASEHYTWDYGTWVPVHYMDPDAAIPVSIVPVVLAADHQETFATGQAVERAFAHRLVRGPAAWPTDERKEADLKFIDLMLEGRLDEAWAWFPEYAKIVDAEMGGRSLAFMLGGLMATGADKFETAQFGPYAQSSAAGNANVSLKVAA